MLARLADEQPGHDDRGRTASGSVAQSAGLLGLRITRPHANAGHIPSPRPPLVAVDAARYDQAMSGVPADLPPGSAVVLTNPDEDASPEAFRAFIDELLAGPEPELESVDAAGALRALRVDAQA